MNWVLFIPHPSLLGGYTFGKLDFEHALANKIDLVKREIWEVMFNVGTGIVLSLRQHCGQFRHRPITAMVARFFNYGCGFVQMFPGRRGFTLSQVQPGVLQMRIRLK